MNILQLLCVCSVVTASFNDTESIPLVNNNKAALKAEIDFSEFNSKMKNLVTVQVPADIKERFQNYITSEEFKEMVKNEFKQEFKDLTKEMVKSTEKLNNKREGPELVDHSSSQLEKNGLLHAFTSLNQRFDTFQQQTNAQIKALQEQIPEKSRKVAITACTSGHKNVTASDAVKFESVKFHVGLRNISSMQEQGKFICEKEGLYQISVSIMSYKTGVYYSIVTDKGQSIVAAYLDSDSHVTFQRATAVIVVYLKENESLWIKPAFSMTVYSFYSCLTIINIG